MSGAMACPQDSSPLPWVFQRCLSLRCSWICSCSCIFLCTSPLYVKPGTEFKSALCKWKHLELLASWHVEVILSYLGPFWTHFPKSLLFTREMSMVHPGEWWPSSATQVFTGSGGRWKARNYRGREAWEKTSNSLRHPLVLHPFFLTAVLNGV